jgi:hypothetical protein
MTATDAGSVTGPLDPFARQERLAERVRRLRVAPRLGITGNDRWMLVVGGVLLPLGLVLVLLGWYGASRSVLVFEQIPYLISGGLLGVALVVAGGFVYFAYWLTLLVRESRTATSDLQSVLLRVETLLQEQATPRTARTPAGTTTAYQGEFVATKTGSMIHRTDCVAVDGRDNLRTVTPKTPGLTPCRLCDPLGDA